MSPVHRATVPCQPADREGLDNAREIRSTTSKGSMITGPICRNGLPPWRGELPSHSQRGPLTVPERRSHPGQRWVSMAKHAAPASALARSYPGLLTKGYPPKASFWRKGKCAARMPRRALRPDRAWDAKTLRAFGADDAASFIPLLAGNACSSDGSLYRSASG
jgi:hypothetical protein